MRAALVRAALLAGGWWALAEGEGLLFGALAVAAATAASLALLPPAGRRLRPIGLLRFAGFFARESLRGGVDVALRALARRPGRNTRGTYFVHRTRLRPGGSRAFLVGTIGLLPGTVAVEAVGNEVRIHVLDRDLADPSLVETLERRIAGIMREPAP